MLCDSSCWIWYCFLVRFPRQRRTQTGACLLLSSMSRSVGSCACPCLLLSFRSSLQEQVCRWLLQRRRRMLLLLLSSCPQHWLFQDRCSHPIADHLCQFVCHQREVSFL